MLDPGENVADCVGDNSVDLPAFMLMQSALIGIILAALVVFLWSGHFRAVDEFSGAMVEAGGLELNAPLFVVRSGQLRDYVARRGARLRRWGAHGVELRQLERDWARSRDVLG